MKILTHAPLFIVEEIKMALIVTLFMTISIQINAQHVEIQGKAKIAVMDRADTEDNLVVKQPDGTLATRSASTILSGQSDTVRTYATDFELNKLLCSCGNDMKPFLVRSSLERGYSVQDLFEAGVPSANLVAGGATVNELLDIGASPMDIYYGGVPQDSLYGKIYQEGLIFYLDTEDTIPGVEGMVASPFEQGVLAWGCHGTEIEGAQGTAVGTGGQNTIDILADACSTSGIAADTCANLVINGFDDWFLPSIDELALMYHNLHTRGLGNFTVTYHWSSTEQTSNGARHLRFGTGAIGGSDKQSVLRVRAARAF